MDYRKKDFKTPVGIIRFFIDSWYGGIFFDLSENKGCEINLSYSPNLSLNLSAYYTTKCDHAGFRAEVNLFGLELEINIYDARHWNYKAKRHYLPGEEQKEIEIRTKAGEKNSNIEYGDVNLIAPQFYEDDNG